MKQLILPILKIQAIEATQMHPTKIKNIKYASSRLGSVSACCLTVLRTIKIFKKCCSWWYHFYYSDSLNGDDGDGEVLLVTVGFAVLLCNILFTSKCYRKNVNISNSQTQNTVCMPSHNLWLVVGLQWAFQTSITNVVNLSPCMSQVQMKINRFSL